MSQDQGSKSIDFDRVADLYDDLVSADFDIDFWRDESLEAQGEVLELMCGSGRIGMPLIESGIAYTGLDYSAGLLARFRQKLTGETSARLVHADARDFQLGRRVSQVLIGFHALSEVLDNGDKLRVLRNVTTHLMSKGRFSFSVQNPEVRAAQLDGRRSEAMLIPRAEAGGQLEFSWQLSPPADDGRVTGKQYYAIRDDTGRVIDQRELDVRFHLIDRQTIESLIAEAGLEIVGRWGDYDRSEIGATSPFFIYRCQTREA